MSYKRISIIAVLILAAAIFAVSSAFAADKKEEVEASVSADTISYNVNTKKVNAAGSVVITRGDAVIKGDKAFGVVEDNITVTGGPVTGSLPSSNATIETDSMKWSQEKGSKNGVVEAIGNVKIRQEGGNKLDSEYAKWWVDTEDFRARGDVSAVLDDKILICADFIRKDGKFSATTVLRFENTTDKYTISALKVDGTLAEDGSIKQATAADNVVFRYTDKDGYKSIITGAKAVYKRPEATLTITGNPNVPARVVRNDGKTVRADRIVYHEDTNNVETFGNSRITFMTTNK